VNRCKQAGETENAGRCAGLLKELGGVLGLLQEHPESWLKGAGETAGLADPAVDTLIQQRLEARKAKNWAEADRIREELKQAGVILEDTAQGTTWRRG
jgi:cysteinyl-tRNA synthetase